MATRGLFMLWLHHALLCHLASVCVRISTSLQIRVHPSLPRINLTPCATTPFPNKVTFLVPGSQDLSIFWGEMIEPTPETKKEQPQAGGKPGEHHAMDAPTGKQHLAEGQIITNMMKTGVHWILRRSLDLETWTLRFSPRAGSVEKWKN